MQNSGLSTWSGGSGPRGRWPAFRRTARGAVHFHKRLILPLPRTLISGKRRTIFLVSLSRRCSWQERSKSKSCCRNAKHLASGDGEGILGGIRHAKGIDRAQIQSDKENSDVHGSGLICSGAFAFGETAVLWECSLKTVLER
jgi:hypothetical protein